MQPLPSKRTMLNIVGKLKLTLQTTYHIENLNNVFRKSPNEFLGENGFHFPQVLRIKHGNSKPKRSRIICAIVVLVTLNW